MDDLVTAQQADDGLAVVTLNHPPGNALDVATCEALLEALTGSADASAIVLTGQGRLFCGGGDLVSFVDGDRLQVDRIRQTAEAAARVIRCLFAGPVVVAGVNGAVAGAGLGLALACDARVSKRSARFVGGFGALGLSPDTATSYLLPRTVGRSRALRLLFDPAGIDAQQALEWGLVDQLTDDASLLEESRRLATALGRVSRPAVVRTRSLIDSYAKIEPHLAAEVESLTELAAEPAVAERLRSFLGKRPG